MELIPSALRDKKVLTDGFTSEGKMTGKQMEAERLTLRQFYRLADSVGRDVGRYQEVLEYANPPNPTAICGLTEWPPTELLDFMALAQHNGIPTRLLDFTYNPLVAAYFAASSACRGHHGPQVCFSVWAIDLSFLASIEDPVCLIRRINAPKFGSTFLAAQKGFFLMRRFDAHRPDDVAINKVVAQMRQNLRKGSGIDNCLSPPLIRFDIPVGRAQELMDLLEQEGIDEPHLMPSFSNIAKACRVGG
jgi:hypothetical protein